MDEMMNVKEFAAQFVYAMRVLSVHIAYNCNRNVLEEVLCSDLCSEEDPLEELIEKELDYSSK